MWQCHRTLTVWLACIALGIAYAPAIEPLSAAEPFGEPPGLYKRAHTVSLKKISLNLSIPTSTGCADEECFVQVYVTYPDCMSEENKLPVIVMFNGFQTSSSCYTSIADSVSERGYLVIQYDTIARLDNIDRCIPSFWKCFKFLSDEVEVRFLDPILSAVKAKLESESTKGADFSRQGLLGHSRGGKLAAMHFAGSTAFQTAFLIDPVDKTVFAPRQPSAVDMLRKLSPSDNRTLGILGAGIGWDRFFGLGSCNPGGNNSTSYADVSRPGSWFAILPQSGHMQFLDDGYIRSALNWVCGTGTSKNEDVEGMAEHVAPAWLDLHFRRGFQAASCVTTTDSSLSDMCDYLEPFLKNAQITLSKKDASGRFVTVDCRAAGAAITAKCADTTATCADMPAAVV